MCEKILIKSGIREIICINLKRYFSKMSNISAINFFSESKFFVILL
uniref:ORF1 n=1 Tax=Cryptosporidium parvum TaxID=5807 RepID=Q23713_CRYPV|nr:ORF1 [Cryptosporidium parvum]